MMEVNVHSSPHKNVGNPRAIDGYVISMLHCTPVSMYFGGPGLGTMWGKENASEMLKKHGFGDITMKPSKDRFQCPYHGKKENGLGSQLSIRHPKTFRGVQQKSLMI